MNRITLLFFIIIFSSCNTIKVKDKAYKASNSSIEIGSIGFSKSAITKNDFTTRSFPKLESKIRVEVNVVPFNKKLNKNYLQKEKFNQNQAKIQYVDSLDTKPELVSINILDISGFVSELNSDKNKDITAFLKKTKHSRIVTSLVTTLSSESLSKIKQADTYYLLNNQENKYTLALFKANKKTETIDLQSGVVLGYQVSKCCWAMDNRGRWYLADLVEENSSCNGDTESKVKEKKTTKRLYKM